MNILPYGVTRPAAIAARCAALRTQVAPMEPATVEPALVLVPATPATIENNHAAFLASLRIEREELRHELHTMKACFDDARYFGNGPTAEEIEAAQDRLNDLDDMLIFDDERPFIFGFDDLPTAYFTAQEMAQAA